MSELLPGTGTMVALTTVGSAEAAQKLADSLVQERLAACCNVMRVDSTYVWKDSLCREPEWMILMKTRREVLENLNVRLRELHPYECPEFIAMPIESGYAGYLAWLRGNTGEAPQG